MSDKWVKTVIITGAGASRPLGYATTSEFFNAEISKKAWEPKRAEVFKALAHLLGSGAQDVEDILGLLQPAEEFLKTTAGAFLRHLIQTNYSRADDYSAPIKHLSEQIRDRLFDIYGDEPDERDVENLFLPLLEMLNWENSEIDVFTLNYDLILDSVLEIASSHEVYAYDGFSGARNRYNDKKYSDPNLKLRLFRLHGSLSWIKTGGTIINQRHCARTNRPHIYIPPGFKGDPTLEEYDEPIRMAHRHLAEALDRSQRCIVIGYSFRDAYLNKEIGKALRTNKNLTVLVVDPNVPSTPQSAFNDLLSKNKGRFVHVQEAFGAPAAISEMKKYY